MQDVHERLTETMHTYHLVRTVLLACALVATSCTNLATVTEKRPVYRSTTAAGQLIARTLRQKEKQQPEARIGGYLDAASLAGAVLEKHPDTKRSQTPQREGFRHKPMLYPQNGEE